MRFSERDEAGFPSPRLRGEGSGNLAVAGARRQPMVRGMTGENSAFSPLTIALWARRADDRVVAALSPQAGRGDAHP